MAAKNPTGKNAHTQDARTIRDLTRNFTAEALQTLVDIMRNSDNDATRVTACNSILDRAWGKPSATIEVMRHDLQVVEGMTREDILALAPQALALLSAAGDE